MQTTKIAIVLALTLALGITATSIAYAQTTTPPTTTYNTHAPYQLRSNYWGWLKECPRTYDSSYYHYQQPPQVQSPLNDDPQQTPIPPQTSLPPSYFLHQYPNQGSNQYRYGRGCWDW